uniref:Aminopeptidase n=1 Tax=Oryza punctata TaxID=4537 RepID=A0A0E0M0C7_ORYPU
MAPAPATEGPADQFRGQARLPRFAAPRRYELRLRPDLDACVFTGAASVVLDVSAPTRFLVLNAADLAVDRASIRFQGLAPAEVSLFADDEILVLEFDGELPLGEGVLAMNFNGTLNDQMRGFYRSKYEYKGETKNMAVTQFEAVDARRCFPCWDEPAFKAKFRLTLEVPSELVALSNMPVACETIAGPIKTVHYEESPLMSTYLVAIVVGLFDYVEGVTSEGNKVRVYTQVGKSSQGKFALDVGVKSLNFYKDYFDTPYPLPKLDMVAIPDFAAGAMENYGLVTYREVSLLFDEQSSSAYFKQNMSHLSVDSFFPQWNIWTQFLDSTTSALKLDSLAESHPIEVEIHHASEVDEIFDAISYDKGASVIRMLQSYLGAERFQKALASYIKKYAYSNAKTEDLWAVLEEVSGEPVKDLMTTWTKQQGYPVISVKLKGHDVELEQDQFLLDGSSGAGIWIVPITLGCCSHDKQKKFLLKHKHDNIKAIVSQCDSRQKGGNFWIKLNIDETGFYRVKYDDELTAALRNALQAKKLSLMDEIGIVDDAHALSIACKQTLSSLLHLLYAYCDEADYSVLSHINSVTSSVAKISIDATPDLAGDIKELFIKLLLLPAKKLGWDPKDGESHLDAMLRPMLLVALVQLGHDKTINEGVRRFQIFFDDRNTSLLPPDTRKAAYLSVMHNVSSTNRSGYDALLKVYRESAEGEEKLHVLGSYLLSHLVLTMLADILGYSEGSVSLSVGTLSSCQDKDIVLESLNLIFTDEVRNQDAYRVLGGVIIEARETAWSWLKFTSKEKEAEISQFFATRTKPGYERTLKQSLEKVLINARWIEGIRSEAELSRTVHELLNKL